MEPRPSSLAHIRCVLAHERNTLGSAISYRRFRIATSGRHYHVFSRSIRRIRMVLGSTACSSKYQAVGSDRTEDRGAASAWSEPQICAEPQAQLSGFLGALSPIDRQVGDADVHRNRRCGLAHRSVVLATRLKCGPPVATKTPSLNPKLTLKNLVS